VDQIQAGFIQHITIEQFRGRYLLRNAGDPSQLLADLEGKTYLDMGPDEPRGTTYTGGPWADRSSAAMFKDATPGNSVKTITSFDRPNFGPPVTFEQASGVPIGAAIENGTFNTEFRRLDRIGLIWQFTLDVAAATVDTSNGANDNYWGEARALWTFNGT